MVESQFEERQFESSLNRELLYGDNREYVPGLRRERFVGFDAALFVNHPLFWNLWGLSFPLRGGSLNLMAHNFQRRINRNRHFFPAFSVNLFIQYKRAEFIRSRLGREMPFWNQPYFRYHLTPHQQEILGKLDESLNDDSGLVVYGSPALYKISDLYQFIQEKRLVSKTNFVKALSLKGHTIYTFASEGVGGMAFSEQEYIKSINIFQELGKHGKVFKSYEVFYDATAECIEKSLARLENKIGMQKEKIYREIISSLQGDYTKQMNTLFLSYLKINIFSWVFGVLWFPLIRFSK